MKRSPSSTAAAPSAASAGGQQPVIAERMARLLRALSVGIYEKDVIFQLALLAALAGENMLLLGPPGVGKSMIARRMKWAFAQGRSFEYLMSRFSTPDEIFGPVSISRLRDSDDYVRATDGYLPTADVVFLDEIWKAGPAIQNSLLTAINERLFRNGREELRLPMKLLVAASNELPAKGEGLEALWDRFLIRIVCQPARKETTFDMLLEEAEAEVDAASIAPLQITVAEYASWQEAIGCISYSEAALRALRLVRIALRSVAVEGSEERTVVYVSDRRWRHIGRLLKAEAFLHGRSEVLPVDVLPLVHALWQDPSEIEGVRTIVVQAILHPVTARLAELKKAIDGEISNRRRSVPRPYRPSEPDVFAASDTVSNDYYAAIEQLAGELSALQELFARQMMLADDDRKLIAATIAEVGQQIAFTRQDLGKLM